MIQSRTKEEDCNAGVVFDNLEAPHWPGLKFALDSICEALPTQNVQVLLFNINTPSKEQPPVEGQPAEEQKDDIKPKEFSKDEQDAFVKFAEDINNHYAEIVLRQMNHEDEEGAS